MDILAKRSYMEFLQRKVISMKTVAIFLICLGLSSVVLGQKDSIDVYFIGNLSRRAL
jgi:hypothetical protein